MKRAPLCVWLLVPAFLTLTTAPALAQAKKPEPAKQPAVAPASSVVSTNVKPVKGTGRHQRAEARREGAGQRGRHHDQGEEPCPTARLPGSSSMSTWYDKAGNVVTGDSKRVMKPIMPNEIVTIELRTPKDPKMDRNSYQFSHANGKVQVDTVPKFE